MSLFSKFSGTRHVTLRVTSENDPATFDALAVFDRRGRFATQSFTDRQTPFETELADGDVTIVVRARDATHPVAAEYEVTVAGKRVLWLHSRHGMHVLRRCRGGVIGAGIPDRSGPSADGPPVGALVI